MRRVLIITPTLSCSGGRERVMSNFTKYLYQKLDITFLTLNGTSESYYPMPEDISIKTIDTFFQKENKSGDSKFGYIKDILKLRNFLKSYKNYIIISTDVYITIFLYFATLGKKSFVIANEHLPFNITYSSKFWEKARNFTYPRIAKIVVTLTDRDKHHFEHLGCRKCVTIPNALTYERPQKASLEGQRIIAVGRFTAQKGFDYLLEAYAKVISKYPGWKLDIFGEGPLKNDLERKITDLNLNDSVQIKSPISNIDSEYISSDMYVLSSRYEAFPMVLIEAMSFGLPVVAFDCETGPAEIIAPGEDGLLVPPENVAALADNLEKLMGNKDLRKMLGHNAFENIKRLSPEKVFGNWNRLIQEVE